MRKVHIISVRNPEEKRQLGTDGMKILTFILKKYGIDHSGRAV
jgi:hypothetical protein